jgi:hypothetical protein
MGADITIARTISMVFWCADHRFLARKLLRAEPVSLKFIIHVFMANYQSVMHNIPEGLYISQKPDIQYVCMFYNYFNPKLYVFGSDYSLYK